MPIDHFLEKINNEEPLDQWIRQSFDRGEPKSETAHDNIDLSNEWCKAEGSELCAHRIAPRVCIVEVYQEEHRRGMGSVSRR